MYVRFVDRAAELSILLGLAERGSGVPIYLYGPEGCGKTRLLRELVARLREHSSYLVAYIDALEERDPGRAVAGSDELRRLILDAVRSAGGGPLGVILVYAVARVLASIERRLVEGRHVVIVVDDVARPLGLDSVEAYVKSLLRLVEYDLAEKNPASVLVVASTSEGLSLEKLKRHPTWVSVKLLWGLPREGFEELAGLLGAPGTELVGDVWRFTGGNPRALIQIATVYQWNIKAWLRDLDASIIVPVLAEAKARGLLAELREVLEDPDSIITSATPGLQQVGQLLVEHNLLIYKAIATLTGESIPANQELGIGRYYAWQLPAYRILLRKHLQGQLGTPAW
ncbi:ATP-binding protein [Hyperthermus butylicus]|uniref:Conserved crenarchaeal protein n=1 Tax=Hyperthermus butylicus (strain DSM 5456 / JCM 9403 / PLM1-5) TaxID=415426 RepID=A2BKT7_HYPBU|nr:ATP-binding protein [Hyperthermus butylicus]ABM80598.1 conserved crenarchaeal protein [Hyperthermus butylicus DSM 5456]